MAAATDPGPLAHGAPLRLTFAGAEATVAIGVRRLGHTASWTGRVGADAGGAMILDGLRAADVDVTRVVEDADAPTGLMLRERRTGDHTRVVYYRRGMAGSRLAPEDVDGRLVAGARVLHVTGITPALGDAPGRRCAMPSRPPGRPASRSPWTSTTAPCCGPARGRRRTRASRRPVRRRLRRSGGGLARRSRGGTGRHGRSAAAPRPREAVLKLGSRGALAATADGTVRQDAVPITPVDPIGAGDSFVAGYLASLLDGAPPRKRLRTGAVCGAFAVAVRGDWENLPAAPNSTSSGARTSPADRASPLPREARTGAPS